MFKTLSVILTKRNGTGLLLRQSVLYSKVFANDLSNY